MLTQSVFMIAIIVICLISSIGSVVELIHSFINETRMSERSIDPKYFNKYFDEKYINSKIL